jgi:hypothetical protein
MKRKIVDNHKLSIPGWRKREELETKLKRIGPIPDVVLLVTPTQLETSSCWRLCAGRSKLRLSLVSQMPRTWEICCVNGRRCCGLCDGPSAWAPPACNACKQIVTATIDFFLSALRRRKTKLIRIEDFPFEACSVSSACGKWGHNITWESFGEGGTRGSGRALAWRHSTLLEATCLQSWPLGPPLAVATRKFLLRNRNY